MPSTRRAFLRGTSDINEIRPPWLRNPSSFTDDCTRCGRCISLCPESIIARGHGSFPVLNFALGECTFCATCTTDCEADLFAYDEQRPAAPWQHQAHIDEACLTYQGVMCRSCEDACEPRALLFPLVAGAVPHPIVDSEACTGCGACVKPCPQDAITMLEV